MAASLMFKVQVDQHQKMLASDKVLGDVNFADESFLPSLVLQPKPLTGGTS
jgi:hypothetical protein